jgi:predicted dehydrogenase
MEKARELGKAHGVPAFRSAEEFPPETRAVVIAAPTPAHHGLARTFLERGGTVCGETVDRARGRRGRDYFLGPRKNRVLQVGHIERFNPAVVEMVRQAKDPLFIEASRLGPTIPGWPT